MKTAEHFWRRYCRCFPWQNCGCHIIKWVLPHTVATLANGLRTSILTFILAMGDECNVWYINRLRNSDYLTNNSLYVAGIKHSYLSHLKRNTRNTLPSLNRSEFIGSPKFWRTTLNLIGMRKGLALPMKFMTFTFFSPWTPIW